MMIRKLRGLYEVDGIMAKLTKREREIVALLAQGRRQTDIARLLFISPRTVETHTRNMRKKTSASSTLVLTLRAVTEMAES